VGLTVAAGGLRGTSELAGIMGGCAILFTAGLADDLYSLPPLAKLAAQGAAAAVALWGGLSVQIVHNDVLAAALGALWFVAMTNAFNLLDNMDGLAGTLAAVAATFFAIDAVTVHKERILLVLSLALGCACIGFLPFNFRPRRPAAVFMGDSGSQVLGFMLAALALATSWKVAESTIATVLLPLLALAGVLITFALLVQFAGFLADLEHRSRTAPAVAHTPFRIALVRPRRLVESLVDFALVSASFSAAYLLVVGGHGTVDQRHVF